MPQMACMAILARSIEFASKWPRSHQGKIADDFKDPEYRFWEKNNSEGIARNSEVQLYTRNSRQVSDTLPKPVFIPLESRLFRPFICIE